ARPGRTTKSSPGTFPGCPRSSSRARPWVLLVCSSGGVILAISCVTALSDRQLYTDDPSRPAGPARAPLARGARSAPGPARPVDHLARRRLAGSASSVRHDPGVSEADLAPSALHRGRAHDGTDADRDPARQGPRLPQRSRDGEGRDLLRKPQAVVLLHLLP